MNRRKSKPSPISKVIFILVIGCLALIGFGTYVYVQDSNNSAVSPVGNSGESSLAVEPEESNEAEDGVADNQNSNQLLEEFDNKVEDDVKTELVEEMTDQTEDGEGPVNTQPPIIDISFSIFDESQNTFSTGLVIVNNQDGQVVSCSLTIEAQTGQVSAQKDNVIGQHGISGCRFNNISLAGLSDPSQEEPWKVVIQGKNTGDQAVVTLEKDLVSVDDLNNLINISSGVSYVF